MKSCFDKINGLSSNKTHLAFGFAQRINSRLEELVEIKKYQLKVLKVDKVN